MDSPIWKKAPDTSSERASERKEERERKKKEEEKHTTSPLLSPHIKPVNPTPLPSPILQLNPPFTHHPPKATTIKPPSAQSPSNAQSQNINFTYPQQKSQFFTQQKLLSQHTYLSCHNLIVLHKMQKMIKRNKTNTNTNSNSKQTK